jgi:hypothetical protein
MGVVSKITELSKIQLTAPAPATPTAPTAQSRPAPVTPTAAPNSPAPVDAEALLKALEEAQRRST